MSLGGSDAGQLGEEEGEEAGLTQLWAGECGADSSASDSQSSSPRGGVFLESVARLPGVPCPKAASARPPPATVRRVHPGADPCPTAALPVGLPRRAGSQPLRPPPRPPHPAGPAPTALCGHPVPCTRGQLAPQAQRIGEGGSSVPSDGTPNPLPAETLWAVAPGPGQGLLGPWPSWSRGGRPKAQC